MLAAGGGCCVSSPEVLDVGVARGDVGSSGGAVDGDAIGEASDSDEELLPEIASSFLLGGEAEALIIWEGEAAVVLAVRPLVLRLI